MSTPSKSPPLPFPVPSNSTQPSPGTVSIIPVFARFKNNNNPVSEGFGFILKTNTGVKLNFEPKQLLCLQKNKPYFNGKLQFTDISCVAGNFEDKIKAIDASTIVHVDPSTVPQNHPLSHVIRQLQDVQHVDKANQSLKEAMKDLWENHQFSVPDEKQSTPSPAPASQPQQKNNEIMTPKDFFEWEVATLANTGNILRKAWEPRLKFYEKYVERWKNGQNFQTLWKFTTTLFSNSTVTLVKDGVKKWNTILMSGRNN